MAFAVVTPRTAGARELELLTGGGILEATAAAERLRLLHATDTRVASELVRLVDGDGDRLSAMLALHALSAAPGAAVSEALLAALADPELSEHAAWALARRRPPAGAARALAALHARGGFTAMPAGLALERWRGPERRPPRVRRVRGTAPRVAQVLLRGHVDAGLAQAGAGDGGGVVTLLVQLARELGETGAVDESLLAARTGGLAGHESLGRGARITRLRGGPGEDVQLHELAAHRAALERAVEALARKERLDVAHLRFADAGTFAASRALRRAGVKVVFTLAPDPHALIAEGERSGALTRAAFAERESAEHNLFRLRLVDELAATADGLVILPRAGGREEVERLLGRRLPAERTTAVPEGVSLDPIEHALVAPREGTPAARVLARGPLAARPGAARPADHPLGRALSPGQGRHASRRGLGTSTRGSPRATTSCSSAVTSSARRRRRGSSSRRSRRSALPTVLASCWGPPHDDVAALLAIARLGLPGQ